MAKKIFPFPLWFMVLITFIPTYMIFSDETQDQPFADALTLINERNYKDALQILIQIKDSSPEIKHVIADCYTKNEIWEEAAKYYNQAISTEYVLSDYTTYHLAKCYQLLEDYENSVQYYQLFINRYPESRNSSETSRLS